MSYKIVGRATTKEESEAIAGLRIQVWDKDLGNIDEYIGETITDENGNFTIKFTQADFNHWGKDEKPDLYLIVTNKKGAVIYSTEETVRYEAEKEEIFYIQISKDLLNKEPDIDPKDRFAQIVKHFKG
ncbi:MAG: hypothetical protein ACFFD2_00815 [Promethearchaeota archaeon]